jgi:hypothetical protein
MEHALEALLEETQTKVLLLGLLMGEIEEMKGTLQGLKRVAVMPKRSVRMSLKASSRPLH